MPLSRYFSGKANNCTPKAKHETSRLRIASSHETGEPPCLQPDDAAGRYRIVPDLATRRAAVREAFDSSDMLSHEVVIDDLGLAVHRRVWPRRLLHVESMTSIEREGFNTYGGIEHPNYNILSYTWGRWQQAHGPSLPVRGTTWKIPCVKESCFTVESFIHVLNTIARKDNVDFVWLDVACIDQDDHLTKMDEIGNQAGIFAGATECYVWLHGLSTIDLKWASRRIADAAAALVKGKRKSDKLPSCTESEKWIKDLGRALQLLLGNPWFSSLWTLQEACLAENDSGHFLSTEAEHGRAFRLSSFERSDNNLKWLHFRLKEIMSVLHEHPKHHAFIHQSHNRFDKGLRGICEMIENSGMLYTKRPILLYTLAGKRQAGQPLDRIYGIMQVYGLKLGQAREEDKHKMFTIKDLEKQLAAALNHKSAVRAQLFAHTKPPAPGHSWCISQSSMTTSTLAATNVYLFSSTLCSIICDDHSFQSEARFRGRVYTLEEVLVAWAMKPDCTIIKDLPSVTGPQRFKLPYIAWDAGAFGVETEPPNDQPNLYQFLCGLAEEDYEMLLLGLLVDPEPEQMPLPIHAAGVILKPSETAIVGLLVRRSQSSSSGRWLSRRLGVIVLPYESGLITEGPRHDIEDRWLV